MQMSIWKWIVIVLLIISIGIVVVLKARTSTPAKTSISQSIVEKKKLPRLVDLGASRCIPCKMMIPVIEQLTKEYRGKLTVEFIDVWKDPQAGDAYKIESIPTQIFFDGTGKEFFRHEGFFSKDEILSKFKEKGIVF